MDSTPQSAGAEPATTSSRRRGGGQKRKSTSLNSAASHSNSAVSQTTSSKRQAREKPQAVPFPPIHTNGPCTRARVQPNQAAEARESSVKAESRGDHAVTDDVRELGDDLEALEAEIEAGYEKIKSRDKSVHVVPVHAGWFSWSKIHPLEEKMLPSFFNGKSESRTPETYMDIRNWIMKKFHQNPNTLVELKDLSELAVGDVDGRQEVMDFLDYWGLINYHPFPSNEPSVMDVDANDNDESKKKDYLVDKLFQFETIEACTPAPEVPKVSVETPAISSGLFPESVVFEELVKAEGPSVDYHCNSCSADCSRKRYHCQKQADYDLCADCFNSEKFGSDMSPSDFILMEPGEGGSLSGGNWTDQETLLLLEAIEIFRDNWSEIAEHVATKTKAQCILHFVQMPIEDAFSNVAEIDVPKENDSGTIDMGTSSSKTDQDKDTTLEDIPEKTENHSCSKDNLIPSSALETPSPDESNHPEKTLVVGENMALKALKEAFEAVGSLPSPGEKISFAEADNPVMALAAFLGRLVDPNAATASLRSTFKSLSGNFSGEQLAAMHCFPLEDPPSDKTILSVPEEAVSGKIESAILENEGKNVTRHRGGKPDSVDVSLDNENPSNKDAASRDCDGKVDSASQKKKHGSSLNNNPEGGPDVVKTEPKISSNKELDGSFAGKLSQSSEPVKEDISSISVKKEIRSLMTSSSESEDGNKGHKDDIDISKLKRAAMATLSAAAVKAKILAEEEEDQILQLSTFLIEKQLHKLETKLALFADVENMVMRLKEQLERSKNRIFKERTEILRSRLGNNPLPNLATYRAAISHPNTALRPPFMGMNASLRPPISRPLMPQNLTASSVMASSGNTSLMQIADKIASLDKK